MKSNVHDQLGAEKPSLVAALGQSEDLSSTVMAYLNLFGGLAIMQGLPVEGVLIDPLLESGEKTGEFRARVHFLNVRPKTSMIWTPQSNFVRYVGAKAQRMASWVMANPNLEKFFEDFVNVLSHWANHRGLTLADVVVENAMVTRDYILKFNVSKRPSV